MVVTIEEIYTLVKPNLKKYFYGNDAESQKAYEYLEGFCEVKGACVHQTIEQGRKLFPVISPKTAHKR